MDGSTSLILLQGCARIKKSPESSGKSFFQEEEKGFCLIHSLTAN